MSIPALRCVEECPADPHRWIDERRRNREFTSTFVCHGTKSSRSKLTAHHNVFNISRARQLLEESTSVLSSLRYASHNRARDTTTNNATRTNQESVRLYVNGNLCDGQEKQTRRSVQSVAKPSNHCSAHQHGARNTHRRFHEPPFSNVQRDSTTIIWAPLSEQHAKRDCRHQLHASNTILNTNTKKKRKNTTRNKNMHTTRHKAFSTRTMPETSNVRRPTAGARLWSVKLARSMIHNVRGPKVPPANIWHVHD